MNDARRDLLAAVAAGTIPPEEALQRLRALDDAERPAPPSAPSRPATRAERVRIAVAAGTVNVTADPTVQEVVVDGPHRLQRKAGELRISGSDAAGSLSLLPRFGTRRKGAALGIRIAPDLPLTVELEAGRLWVSGLRAGVRVRMAAGRVELSDLTGGADVEVEAGSTTLTGRLADGSYRLRSALGRISVTLDPSSDIVVTARSELGRVKLPAAPGNGAHPAVETEGRSLVLGRGTGRLELSTELGSITVGLGS